MNPIGTKPPLGNPEPAHTMNTPAATARDSTRTASANRPSNADPSLFDAQSSQGPVPCATPAPDENDFEIDVQDILNLLDKQINRLDHEYEHSLFINKDLNRQKHAALTQLKNDLNQMLYPTYGSILKRIQDTANGKNVVKDILFPSKVKSMFVIILKYLEKTKTQQKNIHENSKKLATLPLNCQKHIFSYLSEEDTSATLITSRSSQPIKYFLQINDWKEKFVSAGINEVVFNQIPDSINLESLYEKIKYLTHKTNAETDFWMLAFLSGDKGLIQKAIASKPDFKKTNSLGLNAIHYAALGGNEHLFKHLYKNTEIYSSLQDNCGRNILHYAAFSGHINILQYILENSNIPIDSKDYKGRNILHYAALGGHINILQYILENSNIPIDSKDNNDNNALHCAAMGGHIDTISYLRQVHNLDPLLKNSAGKGKNAFAVAKRCPWGGGPLPQVHAALRKQDGKKDIHDNPQTLLALPLDCQEEILSYLSVKDTQAALLTSKSLQDAKSVLKLNYWRRKLISKGFLKSVVHQLPAHINFNALYIKTKCLTHPQRIEFWELAFLSGDERLIQRTLDSTPESRKIISSNGHALLMASWGGNVKLVEYILKNPNIPIDSTDNAGRNVLHYAAWGGHLDMFEYILKKLTIPLDSKDNDGCNALHFAVHGGHLVMFEYILKKLTIPFYSTDNEGKNALHFAALHGHLDMLVYILENLNIPINSKDNEDNNALHFAARGGHLDMFVYILENLNIPIDSKDNYGRNALHFAALHGHLNVLKHILKNSNILIDSKDNDGNNALHYATRNGRATILFLRKVHNLDPLLQNRDGSNTFAIANQYLSGDELARALEALNVPIEQISDSAFR